MCGAHAGRGGAAMIEIVGIDTPALGDRSYLQYVQTLLSGLDAYPAYYAHMGPANAAGPEALQLSPPTRADAAGVAARIAAGEWVAARIGEVPPGEVWVHCLSGYRAVIAASLLQAAGRGPRRGGH